MFDVGDLLIFAADRLGVNLYPLFDEVDDPKLFDPRARIIGQLRAAVIFERRIRDFDHEQHIRG